MRRKFIFEKKKKTLERVINAYATARGNGNTPVTPFYLLANSKFFIFSFDYVIRVTQKVNGLAYV